jgi:hypothetical protein
MFGGQHIGSKVLVTCGGQEGWLLKFSTLLCILGLKPMDDLGFQFI